MAAKSTKKPDTQAGVKRPASSPERQYDARPDTLDFRDLMYVPTLVEVPTHVPLDDYMAYRVPILDQGQEGACTGFGLATVANYLLIRRRVVPDKVPVSPRMFYENARRYDEWPGEDYSGSSARGAMKGWHKHGICAETDWPYHLTKNDPQGMTAARTLAARKRPLGAYFRVNHKDLIAMHAAIAEVGVLYATASVHAGWDNVGKDGIVQQADKLLGGHAFAIVAYDEQGFWIQNSWGTRWGRKGFCRISYDDWLDNGTDVWVARLGVPVELHSAEGAAQAHADAQTMAYAYANLRPHIVSVGNNGELHPGGDYGTTPQALAQIFADDMPSVMKDWPVKRVLLYAHGGLTDEQSAIQKLADYRPALLKSGVYPLAFIWRTDYWTTLANILQDAVRRRRSEGVLDAMKDFMLDRLDDALEPVARALTGKLQWDEMKKNALAASNPGCAAYLVAGHLKKLTQKIPGLEIHIVGHSAGSILHAPLLKRLTGTLGLKVRTCTLWAPACTVELFKNDYMPAIQSGALEHFTMFALTDKAEQDDNCAQIYHKSLLYLVSNAFEDKPRIPLLRDEGVPILGLHKFVDGDRELAAFFKDGGKLVLAPNCEPKGSLRESTARHHGDFEDDVATARATLGRILQPAPLKVAEMAMMRGLKAAAGMQTMQPAVAQPKISFQHSASSLRQRRTTIDALTRLRG